MFLAIYGLIKQIKLGISTSLHFACSCLALPANQKNPRAHKNKIGTSTPPPFQKTPTPPPPKTQSFMGVAAWGVFSRKNETNTSRPQKIGAAISGPRITGGKITDFTLFLSKGHGKGPMIKRIDVSVKTTLSENHAILGQLDHIWDLGLRISIVDHLSWI